MWQDIFSAAVADSGSAGITFVVVSCYSYSFGRINNDEQINDLQRNINETVDGHLRNINGTPMDIKGESMDWFIF